MKLSVIVPTYNRAPLLARSLPTMLRQDIPPRDYEVVVVADGCTDGTRHTVQQHGDERVTLLEQPRQGAAAARNAGLGYASGDILVFLDDDFLCPPGLLRAHLEAHDGQPNGVAFGPYVITGHGLGARFVAELTDSSFAGLCAREAPATPRDFFVSANTSLPRQLVCDAGGFDERFRAGEDAELGYRLWQAGVPFRFAPAATAQHVYTKPAAEFIWQDCVAWGRGEAQLAAKHAGYGAHSLIGWMVRGPVWRPVAWRGLVEVWPRLQVPWAAAANLFETRASGLSTAFMRHSMALSLLHGALLQAGSWPRLARLLSSGGM